MSGKYPAIAAACLLVSLDNGGINRGRSEKKQRRDFLHWIDMQEIPNLPEIDAWLGALSEEELDLFCCGGTDEPETQEVRARSPAFANALLDTYFEEVC